MGRLKMDKMRRAYEMQDRDGDYFKIPNGDSLIYVHPPCREEAVIQAEKEYYTKKKMNKEKRQAYLDVLDLFDGVNFLETYVHFGVGKNNRMTICLDETTNPIVNHPIVQKNLRKKGIKLKGDCPVCTAIETGELDDEQMDAMKLQKRYVFGVTPIKTREKPSKDWVKLPPSPTVLWAGKTIYDGIMDLFFESDDISDPAETIYAKINRKGKGKFDTKYKIAADTQSLKKPKKLSKKFFELVEKAMDGGSADLFKIMADSTVSYDEIVASLSGVRVERSRDDDDDDDDEVEDVEETEEESDDEGEEEDEEDEDDEDDEDEDDEDEPEPKPEPKEKPPRKQKKQKKAAQPAKKRGRPKKVVKADDEEEEDDDDDEDLDDLDAELEKIKKRAKPKEKAKAKPKKKK